MLFEVLEQIRSEEERELLLGALTGAPGRLAAYTRWLEARGERRGQTLALALALDERPGDTALEQQLAALLPGVDRVWWDLLRPGGQIRHCGAARDQPTRVRFAFRCPLRWEQLQASPEPTRRHCPECREDVHWVETSQALRQRARAGQCVAVPASLAQQEQASATAMMIGRPDPLEQWARAMFQPPDPEPPSQ